MSPHAIESAQDAIEVARPMLEGSTHELTWLENEMVKTFLEQNSLDLDARKTEN